MDVSIDSEKDYDNNIYYYILIINIINIYIIFIFHWSLFEVCSDNWTKSLDVSIDSEKDYDNNIYYYILSALLGGRSIYEKIKVNDGEQRQLVDNIFKRSSTSSTVPYFVGKFVFIIITKKNYKLKNTLRD